MSESHKHSGGRPAKESEVMKEQMKKKAALKRKLKEKFKLLDYFGQGVSFTWDGEEQFRTTFGATISLILLIVLLAYGLSTLAGVIRRDDPVITTTSLQRGNEEDSM